ncbi:MAG: hypothetical protein ACYC33_05525 [Thermoleophilia bacterium]
MGTGDRDGVMALASGPGEAIEWWPRTDHGVEARRPHIWFMTNPQEDRLLSDATHQRKIAPALADAAARFHRGQAG